MGSPDRLAPTPLFDRLVSLELDDNEEERRRTALDWDGLLESVARELSRLLTTRVRLHGDEDVTGGRTTLSYGVRDYMAIDPRSLTDRDNLAHEIEQSIQAFEPRLTLVKVHLDPPPEGSRHLQVRIEADLVTDQLKEPVAFALARDGTAIPYDPDDE